MQMLTSFFDLLPQCCDAKNYIQIGQECATLDQCYNDLRPMGAAYWFSIPYRLGWEVKSLIYIHVLLTVVSVLLSVMVVNKFYTQTRKASHLSVLDKAMLLIVSALVHGIFLYPVLQITITDAPASSLVLISTWLLILIPEGGISRTVLLAIAGLLLGISAWMRVFYLIPVFFVTIVWVIIWLCHRQRKFHDLAFLVILIPIIVQYSASFKHSGRVEYLPPDPGLMESHLDTTATGYDSVLPGFAYYWYGPCENYQAIRAAVKSHDLKSLACQAIGKLNYYLGSFSTTVYWYPENYTITNDFDLNIKNTAHPFTAVNFLQEENNSVHPDNSPSAFRLWKDNKNLDAEIIQPITFSEQYKYKVSLKAWSPTRFQYITLEIKDHATHNSELKNELLLTNTPQPIVLNKYLAQSGLKDIVLGFPYVPPDSENGKKAKALGATINQGDFYITDVHFEKADLTQMRTWSYLILSANGLAIIGTVLLLIKIRNAMTSLQWLSVAFLAMCCLILLAIAPEQRFAIAPLIFLWCLFFTWIAILFKKNQETA